MTDREAFALAVAKWRKLSDQEKEEWRVKPRKGSKTKARSIRATASVDVGDLEMQISSGDEPMGRDEEASGEAGDSGSNEEDSGVLAKSLRVTFADWLKAFTILLVLVHPIVHVRAIGRLEPTIIRTR